MPKRTKLEPIQADASLAQARQSGPAFKKLMREHMGHGQSEVSIREDDYQGHHIVIKTTYEVLVDGKKFHATFGVSNAGNVQYHGIPNVAFASAIDLMRCVIDQFPDEFPKTTGGRESPGTTDHAGHDHVMHAAPEVTRKPAKPRVKQAGN